MNDEEAYDFHHEGDTDRDLPYACREERAHIFRRHDVHEEPHRDRKSGKDHACHTPLRGQCLDLAAQPDAV